MAISIDRIKKLLNRPDLPDKEAEEIRDAFRTLAEILITQWREKIRNRNLPNTDPKANDKKIIN